MVARDPAGAARARRARVVGAAHRRRLRGCGDRSVCRAGEAARRHARAPLGCRGRRTAQLRLFIGPLVMAIAVGAATSGAGADFPAFLSTTALVLAAMMLIFGGRLIRNDLRHDMLNLPLLKSLPI